MPSRRLEHLWLRRWWQLCTEDSVPEATRDAETVLIIHEMVLEMVFLQFLVEGRQSKTWLARITKGWEMFHALTSCGVGSNG